jgi:hypothetical protein
MSIIELHNKQNIIDNIQLEKIFLLLGQENIPRRIAIFKSKFEYFVYLLKNLFNIREMLFSPALFESTESMYNPLNDSIRIFSCDFRESCNTEMQYEILYALVWNCRVRHYFYDYLKTEDINLFDVFQLNDVSHIIDKITSDYDDLILKYVDGFMDKNSKEIKAIMGWEYEICESESV